jgi:hypothetical protein
MDLAPRKSSAAVKRYAWSFLGQIANPPTPSSLACRHFEISSMPIQLSNHMLMRRLSSIIRIPMVSKTSRRWKTARIILILPLPPLVVRSALLTLEIETYIDLKAPKLAARFAPDQSQLKARTSAPKQPAKKAQEPAEDADWDAENWDC